MARHDVYFLRIIVDALRRPDRKNALRRAFAEIESLGETGFALTSDHKRCRYCTYRSYCDRGVQAGSMEEMETDLDDMYDVEITIDFEHIAEIEF